MKEKEFRVTLMKVVFQLLLVINTKIIIDKLDFTLP